jgi:hypothetical protein
MALFYYKLKSIIIISFCCVIFYQCSQKNLESEDAQDNILNKELFSKVLVEFALAESAANLNIKGVSVQKIDSVYAFASRSSVGKEVSFGDNVIGQSLTDGATVNMSYLITSGAVSNKANNFTAGSTINSLADIDVSVVSPSAGGSDRESVDSIKFSTASQFATQNRLITFKDYETYILQNYTSLDSISVWGGDDEEKKNSGKIATYY